MGPHEITALHPLEQFAGGVPLVRRLARQQVVECGTQTVNVGARPQRPEVARGLLRAHVGRGPERAAGQGLGATAGRRRHQRPLPRARLRPARCLCQAPVNDQRLTMLADDDVARLDVAVEHAAAVRVFDRVAHIHKAPEQPAQFQPTPALILLKRFVAVKAIDRFLERIATDKPHGVKRAAVGVGSQAIYGNDAGMLEAAGDLGLGQEPLPARCVVGVVVEYLLERHLAVKLGVERDKDGSQASAGMRPQHAEPDAVGAGCADRVAGGPVEIVAGIARDPFEMTERRRNVGIG